MNVLFFADCYAGDESNKRHTLRSFGWRNAGGPKNIVMIDGRDWKGSTHSAKLEDSCVSESIHYELRKLNAANNKICTEFKSILNAQCSSTDVTHINECLSNETEWIDVSIDDVSTETGISKNIIESGGATSIWRMGVSRNNSITYTVFVHQTVEVANSGVNVIRQRAYIARNGRINSTLDYGMGAPFVYNSNIYSITIDNGEITIDNVIQSKMGSIARDIPKTVCAYSINDKNCKHEVKR